MVFFVLQSLSNQEHLLFCVLFLSQMFFLFNIFSWQILPYISHGMTSDYLSMQRKHTQITTVLQPCFAVVDTQEKETDSNTFVRCFGQRHGAHRVENWCLSTAIIIIIMIQWMFFRIFQHSYTNTNINNSLLWVRIIK